MPAEYIPSAKSGLSLTNHVYQNNHERIYNHPFLYRRIWITAARLPGRPAWRRKTPARMEPIGTLPPVGYARLSPEI